MKDFLSLQWKTVQHVMEDHLSLTWKTPCHFFERQYFKKPAKRCGEKHPTKNSKKSKKVPDKNGKCDYTFGKNKWKVYLPLVLILLMEFPSGEAHAVGVVEAQNFFEME